MAMLTSESDSHYTNWLWKAPLGLAITGFGLSLLGNAILARSKGRHPAAWFSLGTIALLVCGSGLSVFADAAKDRAVSDALDIVRRAQAKEGS